MGIMLRIFAVIGLLATAGAIAKAYANRDSLKLMDCKSLLSKNRKELIKKMNKDIEETEERISPENHEKIQKELEKVDWDKSEKCE